MSEQHLEIGQYREWIDKFRSKVSRYGRAADLAPTIECVDSKPTMILEEA